MKTYNIEPKNIYNIDEEGFMLGQALKVRVICRKVRRNLRYTQNGSRELVPVIEAIAFFFFFFSLDSIAVLPSPSPK